MTLRPYDLQPIEVFIALRQVRVECDLGEAHNRTVVARKVLGPAIGVRPYNSGYDTSDTPVRPDRQGRYYHAHPPLDYWGGTAWVRDDDKVFAYSSVSRSITLAQYDALLRAGRILEG